MLNLSCNAPLSIYRLLRNQNKYNSNRVGPSSMLRAVLYISDSTLSDESIEKEQISDIHNTSKTANDDHQITGVLAYHQKKFFHVLEGEPTNIEYVLQKIQNDKRNENLSILIDITHEDRIYNDWEFVESQTEKQSQLLSKLLQQNIDLLPMLDQDQHDVLEDFVINIFG